MVFCKTCVKLMFVGTACLIFLMLSVKILDWRQGFILSSSTTDQAFSTALSQNRNNTTKDYPEELREKTSVSKFLQKRLPNCLIIGFSKCGTHALRTFLTLHPSVVANDLELGFFNKHYDRGIAWYRDQMPLSLPNQIVIEKTPSYISNKEAIVRMHNFDASLKLIILVRDPVVRVQSMYARAVWKGHGDFDKSFTKWLKDSLPFSSLIGMGNYAPYIRDVLSIFDEDQVLVLDGELLSKNPAAVLQMCEYFLNIKPIFRDDFFIYDEDKGFFCVNTSIPYFDEMMKSKLKLKIKRETGCFGDSKGREHPQMSKQLQERLFNIFRTTTEELFQVIGKRFDWTGFN